MGEEKFDVIIVGAGLSGMLAAYTLAKEGLEVLVLERGDGPGTKNMTGGRMYAHGIEKVFPNFGEEAPVERKIVKERVSFITADGGMTMEYGSEDFKNPEIASYSIMRAKFDPWLAEKAEEAGAMFVYEIRVDDLIVNDGKVCGIIAGEEEMYADVVLLADGVNSLLAQKLGMKKELTPHQVAVGAKEIIRLGEDEINKRFGVDAGEGVAWLLAGHVTGDSMGGGFLYTCKDCVSLGMVCTIAGIGTGNDPVAVPEMVNRLKNHPLVKPLIADGELVEYSAHLVTEAGYNMLPELYRDGVLVSGDAAGMVINFGYTIRGMDFAMESGRLAAETILEAKKAGDFSKNTLSKYRAKLEDSFVLRDLKHYQKLPDFLENPRIFTQYPGMVDEMMKGMFVMDGSAPVKMSKKMMAPVKKVGLGKLLKDGMKAMGAM